jgi:hypothetical protein
MENNMTKNTVYLGDGLWAECDGYMIRLMANSQDTPDNEVFMEDWVFQALLNFAKSIGWLVDKKDGQP